MGIDKLIKDLQKQLSKGEKKGKDEHLDSIDQLLLELGLKEKKLEKKLDKAKGSGERKRIKLDLKVVKAQMKKGKKRRTELAQKAK